MVDAKLKKSPENKFRGPRILNGRIRHPRDLLPSREHRTVPKQLLLEAHYATADWGPIGATSGITSSMVKLSTRILYFFLVLALLIRSIYRNFIFPSTLDLASFLKVLLSYFGLLTPKFQVHAIRFARLGFTSILICFRLCKAYICDHIIPSKLSLLSGICTQDYLTRITLFTLP